MEPFRAYLSGLDRPAFEAFAVRIGIVPKYLEQLRSGFRRPSYDLMVRIRDATDGAVSLDAWSQAAE